MANIKNSTKINKLNQADKKIYWFLKILLGACLATPLLVSGSFLFRFSEPKIFAFRILVEISAVLFLYLALKYPCFRPRKSVLNLAVLAFFSVFLVSALAGADWYSSFWGSADRKAGFWDLLHFGLFFLMANSIFKSLKEWRKLFVVSVLTASFIAFLAILQRFFSLGALLPQSGRVYSLVGNAGFLGSYLIFNFFFAGYLFLTEKGKFWSYKKLVWVFSLAAQFTAILFSGTRGAFLGLIVGLAVFCAVFISAAANRKIKKYFVIFSSAAAVLVIFLFVFKNSPLIKENPVLDRLVGYSLSDSSVQNRFILWQKAWVSWQEKPIFGWGPENFGIALNKNFDVRLAPYEAWFDRAHNFIFDYGVALGWLGFLSYLGLFAALIFYLKKISAENFFASSVLASLAGAYLVQNLFIFDTFVSFLPLFFVLAFSNFLAEPREVLNLRPKNLSFGQRSAIFAALVFVSYAAYAFSLKPALASSYAGRALALPLEQTGNYVLEFEKILKLKAAASDEIVYQFVFDFLSRAEAQPGLTQNENFFKLASDALESSLARSPGQVKYYIALGWLRLYFSGADSGRIGSAVDLGRRAKKMAPAKKDAYLLLVAGYSLRGDRQAVSDLIKEAGRVDERLSGEIAQYAQKFAN